jgi:Zn-dependent peptidase ImmA (M78 family)
VISSPKISIQRRPDTESDICEVAERLLQNAGVVKALPTPVDELIAFVGIENVEDTENFKDEFIASLPRAARSVFEAAWDKVRGIADLRERAVYVPKATSAPRIHFAKSHELGHQVLPWQKIRMAYRDDDYSLSSEVQELFDIEANFFAAEIIFQGTRFTKRLRDYEPSFAAVFLLADEHGASETCNSPPLRRGT